MKRLINPYRLHVVFMVWVFSLGLFSQVASAEQLFRIASGAQGATYYPVAKAIAAELSQPGVLKVEAVASNGSTANLNAIASGQMESGFSQADIAAWHYTGTGMVRLQFRLEKLRLIANLYPENIHVVVRKSLNLKSIEQLKGLRVAIDEPGSGVLINARQILRAYGLTERDILPLYIKGSVAADRMKAETVDALFFVGGVPSSFITDLAASAEIALLPIEGNALDALRLVGGFYTASSVPANAYKGVPGVTTLSVAAQWYTSADVDADLVYSLTKRLFSPAVLAKVRPAHPAAATISPMNGGFAAGMLLHPGAERFYRESGLLK